MGVAGGLLFLCCMSLFLLPFQGIDVHIMDEERKREFCWRCTGQLSVREMCLLLQQTADDTKASYVRTRFALGGSSTAPRPCCSF